MLNRTDTRFFKLAVGQDRIGQETDVDIVARCPICGDSTKKKNLKRLHLYYKNDKTKVNCFNGDCPCKTKTMYSFLRDYFPALFDQYKRETFQGTLDKLSKSDNLDVFLNYKEQKIETNLEIKQDEVITQDLTQYFKEIESVPEALQYIKSREYTYNEKYGKWYYGHQNLEIGEKFYDLVDNIIIPLYYNGVMYGFYSRNIYNKNFSTYMSDVNIGYKIWNWFNIDKSKPTYIFEGIFDALSPGFENIIGAIGAIIPGNRIQELKKPVFVLDNDKTGVLNSLQYTKKGYKVYIQPNQFPEKDMNKLRQNHPNMDLISLIQENLYTGIAAEIRLKEKL